MRYQVPQLSAYESPDYGVPAVRHPREEAGREGIYWRARNFGACPPGEFAPALGAYDAYGAPVVLHRKGDAMASIAGGIFPQGSSNLEGFGDASADALLAQLLAQGKSMADALAQIARGKQGQNQPQGESPEQRAIREAEEAKKAAGEDTIFGIPTPVALIGGLGLAYLALKKR